MYEHAAEVASAQFMFRLGDIWTANKTGNAANFQIFLPVCSGNRVCLWLGHSQVGFMYRCSSLCLFLPARVRPSIRGNRQHKTHFMASLFFLLFTHYLLTIFFKSMPPGNVMIYMSPDEN